MAIRVTGSDRMHRPDRLTGIVDASNSIGRIGSVALIQLNTYAVFEPGIEKDDTHVSPS